MTAQSIPQDIVLDILIRLPIKSIGRSRCVSKTWFSILTDTHFIKSYIHRSKILTNNNNTHLMFTRDRLAGLDYSNQIFYSLNAQVCDEPAINLTNTIPSMSCLASVVGSCNGLLCISDYRTFVSMWNPTTREYVPIPSASPPNLISTNRNHTMMGFGCDLEMNEYKVLRIVLYFGPDNLENFVNCETYVYTLGTNSTNSWRTLQDTPSNPFPVHGKYSAVVHLNGALHWAARRGDTKSSALSFFDLKTEKFGDIPLPEPALTRSFYDFGVLMGRLCISYKNFDGHREIWVMKDYNMKDSWVRELCISDQIGKYLQPLTFRENGEILVMDDHERLLIYDPIRKRSRAIVFPMSPNDNALVVGYMESHISVKSLVAGGRPEEASRSKVGKRIAHLCKSLSNLLISKHQS